MVGPVVLVRFGSPLMGWARLCLTYRAVRHQLNLMSQSQTAGICQLDLTSQSQFRNWLLYNSNLWTNQTSISNDCKTLLFRNKRWKSKKWNHIFDQTHKRLRCFFLLLFFFFFPSEKLAVSSVLDYFFHSFSLRLKLFVHWRWQVARRLMHRVVLVFRMPQLMIIDGIPVTDEERNKAEMYFADQFPVSSSWSFARVCNLQMVFQFSCYFSPLCMRALKCQMCL